MLSPNNNSYFFCFWSVKLQFSYLSVFYYGYKKIWRLKTNDRPPQYFGKNQLIFICQSQLESLLLWLNFSRSKTFSMAEMEKETLITKAVDYILSAFKGRATQKIGGKLNDALQNEILIQWSKIEPIFIEPVKDEKLIGLLSGADETRAKKQLDAHLFNKLEEDDKGTFEKTLKTFVEDLDKSAAANNMSNVSIIGNHNVTSVGNTNSSITINRKE